MIDFNETGTSKSGKTKIFSTYANGFNLGEVKFFSRWRKYCFYPNEGTLFDNKCLVEISDFCKKQTDIIFNR